jgi:hypothetical protein
MQRTVLERLLTPERLPRRADQATMAGFAVPAIQERPLETSCEPLLATNMRRTLVPSKKSPDFCGRPGQFYGPFLKQKIGPIGVVL